MGKYSNSDILQNAIDKQNEQDWLKQKHNIEKADVVIVEKSGTWKLIVLIIKTIFAIALFCCAAIGIFTLLYPETRYIFFNLLTEIFNSIMGGK